MSKMKLRQKPRISYYEPEEPNLDEYIFCDKCGDFVYEYCAIHGPLLVVPDDKVSSKPKFPSFVPRAALTIPSVFLHLAPSRIPGAGVGVFSTLTLPRGIRFGPYRGHRTDQMCSMYCWQIYDRNNKPCHVVDAADANSSNWMRYVNCARHWCEQNLVAYQYRGQLYYRTIKIIPRFTELMVFYGSEYAHILHIDLRRYNSPPGYAQKFGAPPNKKPRVDENHNYKEDATQYIESGKTEKISKTKEIQSSQILISDRKVEQNTVQSKKYDKESFICDDCGKKINTKELLIKHISIHKTVRIKSNTLNKRIHESLHSDNKVPNGQKRDIITLKAGVSNNLTDLRAGGKQFKCEYCTYKCSSKGNLVVHIRTHTGDKPFKCKYCNYTCARKDSLETHIRTHTGEKPFKCKYCTYKCTQKGSLETHIRTHTGDKPFKCNYCDYKCVYNSSLKNHIKTHTGEKPFICKYCTYKCTQKGSLETHIRTHTGEKPFKCKYCTYKCTQKGNLERHIRTHTGDKPFKCKYCNYTCARKESLETHIKTHIGEKPFVCKYCTYKCTQKGSLETHIRTHTGEKPFKCNFCNYKSARNYTLKIHIRTHTGEKTFQCNYCDYKCVLISSLKRHIKTHTGENT